MRNVNTHSRTGSRERQIHFYHITPYHRRDGTKAFLAARATIFNQSPNCTTTHPNTLLHCTRLIAVFIAPCLATWCPGNVCPSQEMFIPVHDIFCHWLNQRTDAYTDKLHCKIYDLTPYTYFQCLSKMFKIIRKHLTSSKATMRKQKLFF